LARLANPASLGPGRAAAEPAGRIRVRIAPPTLRR
jgi:hypothetical protein